MRPVSIVVSFIAAVVVIGHVVPHLLAPRYVPPEPRATLQSAQGVTPPLIAPSCQLQPPLTEAERRPMLAALTLRYPHLTAEHRDLFRRFQTCGVDMRAMVPRYAAVGIR